MGELPLSLERIMRVVVIEEDAAMRALIFEWLADAGHEVRGLETASVGTDVGIGGADVVVANIRNLRADGLGQVQRVRTIFPGSPVIGLSTQLARSLWGDSELVRSLGASALLAKPFGPSELLAVVARAAGVVR
jgi:DNA-binding response OmpR family regulator